MVLKFVVACAVLGIVHGQPVKQVPVLKDGPVEVLYRVRTTPEPFALNCEIESGDSSEIRFKWTKDDQAINLADSPHIEQQDNKLRFKVPQDDDEGVYQCFATVPEGIASSTPIKVKKTFITVPSASLKRVTPVKGRPFHLDCELPEGYPTPTIEWKRQIGDGQPEGIRNPRIFSPQGNLYFTNATGEDVSADSKYVCYVSSPALDQEAPLAEYLVEALTEDPEPVDNELEQLFTSSDFTAKVGEVTPIYCIYGGNALPPDWWKDGVNVNNSPGDRVTRHNRSKGKRLLIKETLPEDEGDYTCVVKNEAGKVENHTVHLSVVSAPRFAKKPEKRVQASEGTDVVLPCVVENIAPSGDSHWTYNAEPVDNARVSVTELELTIKNVQKTDSGYYGCKAVNELGQNYTETYLQVL